MTNTFRQARTAIYIDDNPDEGIALLENFEEAANSLSFEQERELFELLGYASLRKRDFDKASQYFKRIDDFYQAGYAQLLKGDAERARAFWQSLVAKQPNHWGPYLYGLATITLQALPSYLQIRNHIEANICHLLWAKQNQLVDNIIRYADFLADVNYESYKFMGRAFLNSGFLEQARPLLLRGQKLLPNDPEVYYHLGQLAIAQNNPEEAVVLLNQCLQMCPTYTPAKTLQQEILSAA